MLERNTEMNQTQGVILLDYINQILNNLSNRFNREEKEERDWREKEWYFKILNLHKNFFKIKLSLMLKSNYLMQKQKNDYRKELENQALFNRQDKYNCKYMIWSLEILF